MTADRSVVAEDGYQERDDCAEVVKAARAEALRDFAEFIIKPKHDGLDGYTLAEVYKEALHRAEATP